MFHCNQDQNTHITLSPSKSKVRSERAEVVKFFVDNIKNKEGKPYQARFIAVKLGHLKELKDLYYLKSTFQDTLNRRGKEAAQKYFWWAIK